MTPRFPLLLLSALLLLTLPATAQLPRHELSGSLGMWDSDEVGNGPALAGSYARHWTGWFATRAGGLVTRQGDFTVGVAHLSGELHLFRAARVSPWVGAGGAFAYTHRAASNDHFTGSEETLTGIYTAGVDVAVSPKLAVGAEYSYMNYEVELGARGGFQVDPIAVLVTGRWRW